MQENYMKQDIVDAFIELSKNQSFDKITATEIAKKCGISRQTFYYHFQDVMDVAEAALVTWSKDMINFLRGLNFARKN